MVISRSCRVAVLCLVAALATACSAPADASNEEITQWMNSRNTGADTALGEMQARIGPSDEEPPGDQPTIEMTFPAPAQIDAALVECLGEGTLDITVLLSTRAEDDSQSLSQTTTSEVRCGDTPHKIPLGVASVTELGISGSGADREGAWSARVLGTLAD